MKQATFARRVASDAVGSVLAQAAGPLLRRASRLAARHGLDRLVVVVSFDCDTLDDAGVVLEVHDRLTTLGVVPSYAVPGSLLAQAGTTYRSLADQGVELLNHGWQQHCELDAVSRTYTSSYFYDTLTPADVVRDIERGHEAHLDVLGRAPVGFRTPHFGTFQRAPQLALIHGVLAELGYGYSSSTTPTSAYRRGAVWRSSAGPWEVPVSGCPSSPHRVLDTWSHRFAPGRRGRESTYLDEVRALMAFHERQGLAGVVNLYADPTQVVDWPEWFTLMGELAPYALPSFSSLLDELR